MRLMSGVAGVVRPQPGYVRLGAFGVLIAVFALGCILGRINTYLVMLLVLVVLITPSLGDAFRLRQRNPIDLMLVAAATLPSVSFAIVMREPYDLAYIVNFLPLVVVIPFRWQLDRLARADGAVIISWLSLAGATIALGVAVVQVLFIGNGRAGPPLMSVFQFADTAVMLGFLALAGLFVPGAGKRLALLAGPIVGCLAAVIGGTRGAMLALPFLALVAIAVGYVSVTDRRRFVMALGAVAAACIVVVLISLQFGLVRALSGFLDVGRVLAGGELDGPTQERLVMLQGGWEAFLRAPLFGYGWAHMVTAIEPYVAPDYVPIMQNFRHLHNGLFSFAVSAGIPGIISFAILSVAPVVAALSTPRDEQFIARLYLTLILCVAYGVFQLTIIMLGFEYHTWQYAFMTAAFISFARTPAKRF
jgi:O-antigen ligase